MALGKKNNIFSGKFRHNGISNTFIETWRTTGCVYEVAGGLKVLRGRKIATLLELSVVHSGTGSELDQEN